MLVKDRNSEDESILTSLAQAMVQQPKASLQELAKTIGISKSTLYRFCHTREQLVERLLAFGTEVFADAIGTAGLETDPPLEAFRRLTENNLKHREMATFLMYFWRPENDHVCGECIDKLDAFFLRGQQEGIFQIDIPASALNEIWSSMMAGLIDAERRGRVARSGMASLLERLFLHGASVSGDVNPQRRNEPESDIR